MTSFAEACQALEDAKIAEARATAARIDAETAVLAHIASKTEGSVSSRGDGWKATATFTMYRKVDPAALEAVREAMPPALFEQAFRFKPEVSTTGIKYLQNNEPAAYAIAAQAITATPGKPSVRVERVAETGRMAA
jgi:hypothetical protein